MTGMTNFQSILALIALWIVAATILRAISVISDNKQSYKVSKSLKGKIAQEEEDYVATSEEIENMTDLAIINLAKVKYNKDVLTSGGKIESNLFLNDYYHRIDKALKDVTRAIPDSDIYNEGLEMLKKFISKSI